MLDSSRIFGSCQKFTPLRKSNLGAVWLSFSKQLIGLLTYQKANKLCLRLAKPKVLLEMAFYKEEK